MGEAKSATRRLLARCPWCIYCGGTHPAESRDHVPPKMMFRGKRRPAGMEVPSCLACNQGSTKFEVVANAFGRIGLGTDHQQDVEEFGPLLRDAEANNPGLLVELGPEEASARTRRRLGLPMGTGAFSMDGPIVNGAINRFAAKLGFALHWLETGRIVPPEGAVMTTWFTNYNYLTGQFPEHLQAYLGEPRTLRQGRFQVGERFTYACRTEASRGLYLATFQFAFATLAYVNEDYSTAIRLPGQHVFRPGFIREGSVLEVIPHDNNVDNNDTQEPPRHHL